MIETEVMEITFIENTMMIKTLAYNHESEWLKQLNDKVLVGICVCVYVCMCVCSCVVCVRESERESSRKQENEARDLE